MRLLIFLILFEGLFVQSYDIKDFIPLENVKQKVLPIVNMFKFFKSNMTNQDFYEMMSEDQQKWIMERLATRNDLIRFLKTIYKLITFKKIAKFFIITGMLFFVPVINTNELNSATILNDNDDFDFYAYINKTDYRSIERYNFFTHAVEAFSNSVMVWCVAEHDAFCRFQLMFDVIDQLYPFDQVIGRFFPSSATKLQWVMNKVPTKIRNVFLGKGFYESAEEDDESAESEEEDEDD